MTLAIGILTFAAVALGLFGALRPRPDVLGERLRLAERDQAAQPRIHGSVLRRVAAPGAARAGRLFAKLLPTRWIQGINRMLVWADEPWSLWGFISAWALSIAVGGIVVAYIWASGSAGIQLAGPVVLIISFATLVPYAVLRRRVKKRQRAIRLALPDALDLLVTSIEAGMGIDAAFGLVVEKTDGPLADAFALYLRQIGLGRSREAALLYVAERSGVEDLIAIARAANQSEELGTSLGDVLRHQASELRALRRQRAQIAAQRAPVLMTIPLALCFLPAMVAVVVVPSILNLVRFVGELGAP